MIESYPFAYRPGPEIGQGYVSKVKELGPDWVVKEFNPVTPDGTPKDEGAYERSQKPRHIGELQETQRILSQDFIYGDKLIPTYWVLGSDENGNEKYSTVQKRFQGKTVHDIIINGDRAMSYSKRFRTFFGENRQLREQMLELIWGTKRALIEVGVFDDFHAGNIAVVTEEGSEPKMKVFDIQNMIRSQRILYGDPPSPPEYKRHVLENVDKHAERLGKYEEWLEVTEEERAELDRRFGVVDGKYDHTVGRLLQMREQNI
ncbi:MAG: hypothetical protein WC243_01715 [Patescibacteria group bacterium]|jgi:hypothetical protein